MIIHPVSPGGTPERMWAIISSIRPHRILDIATGTGAARILEHCAPSVRLLAVDVKAAALRATRSRLEDHRVCLAVMDGSCLGCADCSFDVITILNSLHHLPRLPAVIREVHRVLAPGGRLVVSEMHRDAGSPAQSVQTDMHIWWAEIDSVGGISHQPVFSRAALIEMAEGLPLQDVYVLDDPGTTTETLEPRWQEEIAARCDTYAEKIRGHARYHELRERGHELKRRFAQAGFAQVPRLTIIGVKPAE